MICPLLGKKCIKVKCAWYRNTISACAIMFQSHSIALSPSVGNALFEVPKLLNQWVFDNIDKFGWSAKGKECFGTIDEKYAYIIKRSFDEFCDTYGYNSLQVLRYLSDKGLIKTRQGANHGGHLKTKRVNGDIESCVWFLIRPDAEDH